MTEISEGLTLEECLMRKEHFVRLAWRLPAGSEEKRAALQQVRLIQQMIDRLKREGGKVPKAHPGI